ncbi:MAG TPA: DUF1549 and DUF1553 domain-containing protein [Pirellulales bacterium]|nr:DUF1549 and DUF1553 domain-containing protein [Pirellulales bacterium]
MHARPSSTRLRWPLFAAALLLPPVATAPARAAVAVSPDSVVLDGPETSQQLLVTSIQPDGQRKDGTRLASYESANAAVAVVDAEGLVQPRAEGRTEIVVRSGAEMVRVPVEVTGLVNPRPILFEQQLVPILTKAGCNSGGCHGKADGQNGFKLSVFGSNPAADYDALVKEGRGRRVFLSAPDRSLVLQKATAEVPHGGGLRIEPEGLGHRRLRRWLVEGAGFTGGDAPPIASVEVEPAEQALLAGESQQLRATAIDAAGARRCVTMEAGYESNAATIADVDRRGLVVAGDLAGEAAILVRYQGHVAVSRITIPRPGVQFARPPEANFIDKLVWDKLRRLGIVPSEPADDATFMRRVYLDVIGTLPAADEVRAFLADAAADKRAKLIDRVLAREEYADYWAMRWSDLLRVDRDRMTPPVAVATSRWLRRQFAENRPYDQFVHDIVTVQGSTAAEGPAGFYRVLDTPEALARSISQLFLGVRIECAQCHHHPAEKWAQDDYFALAGFFTGVVRKNLPTGRMAIVSRGGTDLTHPRTGQLVPARALGAPPADFAPAGDRRLKLAEWMTAPDNPYLATAISNRLWAHYLGRGLVEPIDDLRATNPASNEPLLAALASHMREVKFDLKAFTRTLLSSRAYQLSSRPNESNAGDEQNFSHASHKALPAEVLLDAICRVTNVPEKFNGWPAGYRAIQIWDNRMPSYFFRIFGRPVRASVCECERSNEPSITQALHLMNSPEMTAKLHDRQGRVRQLALSALPPNEAIDELCLTALARLPSDAERAALLETFSETGADRRAALEDVLWTLVNSKEFLYNH